MDTKVAISAQLDPHPARLNRRVFTTSRLLEFCSQKELVLQTGHSVEQWPLVVLKELVDNAVDAAEEAAIAPSISVIVRSVPSTSITVVDNGPGIHAGTVKALIDFTTRTSSREAYASPTRGAQGNALKTLVAMPFALDGSVGEIIIEARRVRHLIRFLVNAIRQEPKVDYSTEASDVKIGTMVTVGWPSSAPRFGEGAVFTNRRRLHLAQPTPEPVDKLGRRAAGYQGNRSSMAEVEAV
jgi:DNA topoisomerase VI subunit B